MEEAGGRDGIPYEFGAVQYIYHRVYRDQSVDKSHFMYDRIHRANHLFRKDLKGHFGCVNAIEFSSLGGEFIASGGDDRRVLMWKTEEALNEIGNTISMKGQHHSNIFCLAFDNDNKRILSGGNDEQVILHDMETGSLLDVYLHEDAVYGLAVDPLNSNVFASACDDGRILIFDIRAPPIEEPFCLANYMSPMHAVVYNPMEPRLLATANSKEGIGLWDIRKPKNCLLRYGGSLSQQSCMSVRINGLGNRLIALRRRLPPVLYDLHSATPVFQFDHSGYYNSCTMKSCCFAGEKDEFILSGSDDFNLYMWKIPEEPKEVPWVDEAHLVLKGHRSIVNQVRYNPSNQLILSSGVEKVIKLWSPYALPRTNGDQCVGARNESPERTVYSHEEYINLVLGSGEVMTHDYSQQSTEEDPRMMAFFDSLVQRELEGWSTDDMGDSDGEIYDGFAHTMHSSSPASNVSHSGEEGGFSPFTIAFASVMARQELLENQEDGSNPARNLLDLDLHCPEQATERETTSPVDPPAGEEVEPEENRPDDAQPSVSGFTPSAAHGLLSPVEGSSESSSLVQLGNTDMAEPSSSSAQDSRRSISSLIAQKRKEYLAAVRRAEKRSQSKGKHRHSWSSVKRRKRLKLRRLTTRNEDSSSSDSSDYGELFARFSSDEDSHHSTCDSDQVSTEEQLVRIQSEHRRKTLDLKRLKNLRSRALKSDSEGESENSVPNGVCVTVPKAPVLTNSCKDGHSSDKGEVGPHLSEIPLENRQGPSTSGHAGTSTEVHQSAFVKASTSQNEQDTNRCAATDSIVNTGDCETESNNLPQSVSSFKVCKSRKRNYRAYQKKNSSDED